MSRKIDEINNGLRNVEKMLQQKSKNIEKAQEIQKVTFSLNFLQHLVYSLSSVITGILTLIYRALLTECVTCRGLVEKVAFKNCSQFFHGGNMPKLLRAYDWEPAFSLGKDLVLGRLIYKNISVRYKWY